MTTDTDTTDAELDEPATKRDVRVLRRRVVECAVLTVAGALAVGTGIATILDSASWTVIFGTSALAFLVLQDASSGTGTCHSLWNQTFGRVARLRMETTTEELLEADA